MTERKNNLRLSCPHCGDFARVRKSQTLTPIYREALIECQNAECGWRGTLSLEMTHTLTPSQCPSPEILLPVSRHVREQIMAQLRIGITPVPVPKTTTERRVIRR